MPSQKVRVKDKNQRNISFAEDDYEVAMGLLSETESEFDGADNLDETFVPSYEVQDMPRPSERWSTRTRRSTQEASQETLDRFVRIVEI